MGWHQIEVRDKWLSASLKAPASGSLPRKPLVPEIILGLEAFGIVSSSVKKSASQMRAPPL
jgi:hypothetical protein